MPLRGRRRVGRGAAAEGGDWPVIVKSLPVVAGSCWGRGSAPAATSGGGDRSAADQLFWSESRISVSNLTSSDGSAGAAGSSLIMTFPIQNTTNATMMNVMTWLMNAP